MVDPGNCSFPSHLHSHSHPLALPRPLTAGGISDAILPVTMALDPGGDEWGREQRFKGSVNLPRPLGAIATPSEARPRLLAAPPGS